MTRILFPARILDKHVGGNTTYTRRLAEGLAARGYEVGRIPAGRHPLHTIALESAAGFRSGGSDLLHYSADTGPLVKTRRRSLVTVHGVASRWIDVARTPLQEWTWRTRVKRALASTDQAITVSQSSASDICEVFDLPLDKIEVIPHGIDGSIFQQPRSYSAELAGQVPDFFALYIGNIEPRKNLVELCRAFQTPSIQALDLPLLIAGRPAWNYRDAMREIQSSSNVRYLGFVSDDDRVALMQRCSVFVFPSLYEGFGFPVVEAMAAGAPVVSSHRGSLAEVAGPAFEVERLDAAGISAAVEAAVTDSAWLEKVADVGRSWASTFSWDASIDAHARLYEQVRSS